MVGSLHPSVACICVWLPQMSHNRHTQIGILTSQCRLCYRKSGIAICLHVSHQWNAFCRRDVIRDSARKEFDAKSQEKNPETVSPTILSLVCLCRDACMHIVGRRKQKGVKICRIYSLKHSEPKTRHGMTSV